MHLLLDPVTHRSDRYGWAGWVHWETSGAHFYAWEDPLFFSVDIYTCKPFDSGSDGRVHEGVLRRPGDRREVVLTMSVAPDLREDLRRSSTGRAARPPSHSACTCSPRPIPAPRWPATSRARCSSRTFGNTEELLDKEYEPYEEASVFVCVVDHRRARAPPGRCGSCCRRLRGSRRSTTCRRCGAWRPAEMIAHTGTRPRPDRSTWDIATLAVAPDYRGKAAMGLVTLGLYQAADHAWPGASGIDWFVAILDVAVFRMIRWKLRMTFSGFTGVGAGVVPGVAGQHAGVVPLSDAKARLPDVDPDLHDLLFEGVGLEPAIRPLDLAAAGEVAGLRDRRRPRRPSAGATSRRIRPCDLVEVPVARRARMSTTARSRVGPHRPRVEVALDGVATELRRSRSAWAGVSTPSAMVVIPSAWAMATMAAIKRGVGAVLVVEAVHEGPVDLRGSSPGTASGRRATSTRCRSRRWPGGCRGSRSVRGAPPPPPRARP